MGQTVFRTGNSLAVTIPSPFVQGMGIKAGDQVKVLTEPEKGKLTFKFSGVCQLPLSAKFLSRKKKA